jgi:hypothetical protein
MLGAACANANGKKRTGRQIHRGRSGERAECTPPAMGTRSGMLCWLWAWRRPFRADEQSTEYRLPRLRGPVTSPTLLDAGAKACALVKSSAPFARRNP